MLQYSSHQGLKKCGKGSSTCTRPWIPLLCDRGHGYFSSKAGLRILALLESGSVEVDVVAIGTVWKGHLHSTIAENAQAHCWALLGTSRIHEVYVTGNVANLNCEKI